MNFATRLGVFFCLCAGLVVYMPAHASGLERFCMKAKVSDGISGGSVQIYCWYVQDPFSGVNNDPTGATGTVTVGGATTPSDPMSVPAPPTQQMQAKIKCYASAYGSRFPHVAGYNEIFVPGYGFESSDGTTFIRPTRSGSGTLLDGDTGYPNTMIYASGYHGSVYQNDPLTGVENAILTLVHERGHQNGSDNEDVDDAAGYDAVKAYRADNNGAACSTKSDPNATK